MATQQLPQNPSLENLRKQSKTLLKAARGRSLDALAKYREFHPHAEDAFQEPSLADAQLVVARSYGFPSWPELKRYLNVRTRHFWLPPKADSQEAEPVADQIVRLACLN